MCSKRVYGKSLVRLICLILAAAIAILALAGLCYWYTQRPKRVERLHTTESPREFKHLIKRIKGGSNYRLSRKEAEEDLDELEWLLENQFSYLKTKEVDYKAALDSIRCGLGNGINRGVFALQLRKLMTLFGDGHSGAGPSMKQMYGRSGYLPFLVDQIGGRVVAFRRDRTGFLKEGYPFLRSIDGIDLQDWLKVASQTVTQGSPQFVKMWCVRRLLYVQYLRQELGLETSNHIKIEVETADGDQKHTLTMQIANEYPISAPVWPPTSSRILSNNIGYLRIPRWMSNKKEFLNELVLYMTYFRDTNGLIIDIRGIGGGSRAPLRTLFPFFMAAADPPCVLNIAAYRLGHKKDILDARWLYRADWKRWSPAERESISKAAKTFQPQWQPATDEFSEWHYFVLGPNDRAKGAYYYDRPVVILMSTSNFSASDIFLGAFKGWRNVTLLGSPSAGGSGRYQSCRLENSNLKIRLSSMASFRPNGRLYDGNGIQPDIYAEPIPTDFIGETDSILEQAIERLKTVGEDR